MKYNPKIVIAYFLECGLTVPVTEFQFAPPRRWRFDFAWPSKKVALEVEGGAFSGGRHTRGLGFISDMEKYNMATLEGWKVLRVTPQNLCMLETVEMLKSIL